MADIRDLNTGELIAREPGDGSVQFMAYIDTVRELHDTSHVRYGRCTRKGARDMIGQIREKGVECVYDPMVKPDVVLVVQGTPDEWPDEEPEPWFDNDGYHGHER